MDTARVATREREVVEVRRGAAARAPARLSVEEAKAWMEAQVQSAYEKALAKERPERAEPLLWWDIYLVGVFQPGAGLVPPAPLVPGPLLPGEVIRTGEQALIFSVLVLNPFFPAPSACDILSNFALPVSVEYQTLNLTTGVPGPADTNVTHNFDLVPGQCYYVDVLDFTGGQEKCIFETNVCARILGCNGNTAPPFAGFGTATINLDAIFDAFLGTVPGIPGPAPIERHGQGVRYMVYQ